MARGAAVDGVDRTETAGRRDPAGPGEDTGRGSDGFGGVPLLERALLFGNPDRAAPRISPRGAQIAYLAPLEGVLNVWVAPAEQPQAARPVTRDRGRGIRQFFWSAREEDLLYLQDRDGDENWHLYRVHLPGGEIRDLTPASGVTAQVLQTSHRHPGEILVGLNERTRELHDVYRIDIGSGERRLVVENPEYSGFVADLDLEVRLAVALTPDGGQRVLQARGGGRFEELFSTTAEDALTTQPIGFADGGRTLYLLDSRGRDSAALVALDLETQRSRVLAQDPRADAGEVLVHPTEGTAQAVVFNHERSRWEVLDPALRADFEALAAVRPGELHVASRSLDDRRWIVFYVEDDGPVHFYRWDRPERRAAFLFTNRRSIEGKPLAAMHPVSIGARDGLALVSYLSLPPWTDPGRSGRPARALPLVLLVHGGPWARDSWGYNPYHQLLANRGYAVLSVNFRGSTGFGKSFVNAGDKQWGKKMHSDLLDAVEWAVKQGIAQPERIAIMGGSYGGYAALAGLTLTPRVFACGVDIVGPSRLQTLMTSLPAYWKPAIDLFKTRVGDWTTPEGLAALEEVSPFTHVSRIERPLLIAQGANDPRVKQAESDQIVAAMKSKGIPVTYALFPDEGHGFARPENSIAFLALTEAFLSRHLGGRCQPIGAELQGSSLQVPAGAELLDGVASALGSNRHA